ncbi:MAG: hypothetical protein WA210_09840 [Burkholderiaceae bacterium]
MTRSLRWDPCISHRGDEASDFIKAYFSDASRRVLFVAGAGFDPRSAVVARALAASCKDVRAFLVKEARPDAEQNLVRRAEGNRMAMTTLFERCEIVEIDIFGSDGAVIGGRNIVAMLSKQDFNDRTDVVIDMSALSVGTSFPMVKYLFERSNQGRPPANLHVFVAHDAQLDDAIVPTPGDVPGFVHGFRGPATLASTARAAKLWLPQLARDRRGALLRLHSFVDPHDTCPILPFPASNPRQGDELVADFIAEFENAWSVDTRNIVYGAEDDPLDLYRTILRLDDLRRPAFQEFGGSLLVLSPVGSKIMALGALLAALERDLPVAHLESIGYTFVGTVSGERSAPLLVHIWLEGDVYPQPRPAPNSNWKPAA